MKEKTYKSWDNNVLQARRKIGMAKCVLDQIPLFMLPEASARSTETDTIKYAKKQITEALRLLDAMEL